MCIFKIQRKVSLIVVEWGGFLRRSCGDPFRRGSASRSYGEGHLESPRTPAETHTCRKLFADSADWAILRLGLRPLARGSDFLRADVHGQFAGERCSATRQGDHPVAQAAALKTNLNPHPAGARDSRRKRKKPQEATPGNAEQEPRKLWKSPRFRLALRPISNIMLT